MIFFWSELEIRQIHEALRRANEANYRLLVRAAAIAEGRAHAEVSPKGA